MKKIAVFLSATTPENPLFIEAVTQVANHIVKHDLSLIYGGSQNGAMGILADTVLSQAGEVTGIMSQDLLYCENVHSGLNELIYTETVQQRKQQLITDADAYLVLPGGVGTVDEFFDAWCSIKISRNQKPLGLLNIDNFFTPLVQLMDNMLEAAFIQQEHRDMVTIEESVEALFTRLFPYPAA